MTDKSRNHQNVPGLVEIISLEKQVGEICGSAEHIEYNSNDHENVHDCLTLCRKRILYRVLRFHEAFVSVFLPEGVFQQTIDFVAAIVSNQRYQSGI